MPPKRIAPQRVKSPRRSPRRSPIKSSKAAVRRIAPVPVLALPVPILPTRVERGAPPGMHLAHATLLLRAAGFTREDMSEALWHALREDPHIDVTVDRTIMDPRTGATHPVPRVFSPHVEAYGIDEFEADWTLWTNVSASRLQALVGAGVVAYLGDALLALNVTVVG